MAGRGKQTFWMRGATAVLATFVFFSESFVRKLVGALASRLAEHCLVVMPALLHGEHRVVRAEFILQLLAASWVLWVLRKAPWSQAKLLICAYCSSLLAYYVIPAFTTGAPLPLDEVTGQPLREAAFTVMSFCLLALSDSRARATSAWTQYLSGTMLTLQVLSVSGSIEAGALNLAVSAIGVFCALRFAYAMREVLSPFALLAFSLYSTTLPLRPEITSDTSTITAWYYGLMLCKFIAIGELARMLAAKASLKKKRVRAHTDTFWRAEPALTGSAATE